MLATAMTPSAGFGTVTGGFYTYQQVGDVYHSEGRFVAGTTAASTASIALPAGLNIDPDKLSTAATGHIVGSFQNIPPDGSPTTMGVRVLFFDGSTTGAVFFGYRGQSFNLNKENGSTLFSNSQPVTFKFSVPITGWSNTPLKDL
jgi:hypothetical protein